MCYEIKCCCCCCCYLIYGNLIWRGACESHLRPLELIQKKFIRIITKSSFYAHTHPLFVSTKVLNIKNVHKFLMCQFVFKSLKTLNHPFETCRHSYLTRHNNYLQQEFQRLSVCQRSLSYEGPKYWNSLPAYLREIESLCKFKKELKSYLLSQSA